MRSALSVTDDRKQKSPNPMTEASREAIILLAGRPQSSVDVQTIRNTATTFA